MRRWIALLLLCSWLIWPATQTFATLWDFSLGQATGISAANSTNLTVSTTAVGTTACGAAPIDLPALLYVMNGPIYFLVNAPGPVASGTATPLSTSSFQAASGDLISLVHTGGFRGIRAGAADATVLVQCMTR